MPRLSRLTALALARAWLAGRPSVTGLVARTHACLDAEAPWAVALAERLARLPGEQWRRLSPRSLASWIEREPGYRQACQQPDPARRPRVRRYILRVPTELPHPPLGLENCLRPSWLHSADLAEGLGISTAGLWRLTRPSAWQRRAPLGLQHYHCRLLAKRSGGWRLLEVPEPHLLAIQRRLLDALIRHIPPHESACGYTRGRSVLDHVRAHAGAAVVLKFDLQDFFSAVAASRVQALFTTLGYGDTVARELTALCTTATPEPVLQRWRDQGSLSWHQCQRLRDPHLPQGAPTSAALANLCAFRLDVRLNGLAQAMDARYTRYADDIVISGGRSLATVRERIEAWVGRIALEQGFLLNHRKTRCQRAGQRQTVCHVVVNQRPNLARTDFDRLKAILYRCTTHGPAAENRDGHPHWRQHLQGRVAWAAQLNPAKADRLKRLLQQIDWTR